MKKGLFASPDSCVRGTIRTFYDARTVRNFQPKKLTESGKSRSGDPLRGKSTSRGVKKNSRIKHGRGGGGGGGGGGWGGGGGCGGGGGGGLGGVGGGGGGGVGGGGGGGVGGGGKPPILTRQII